jgi:hypothetical protein
MPRPAAWPSCSVARITGCPTKALDRAHAVATIPTTEHFSLNVAQACLLALYELHLQVGDVTKRLAGPKHAAGTPSMQEFEQTFADATAALDAIAYFKTRNPELVMRTVRSLVFRAAPDVRELLLVRTAAIEVLRTIERGRAAPCGSARPLDSRGDSPFRCSTAMRRSGARAADVVPGGSTGSKRPEALYGSRARDAALPTPLRRGCTLWAPDGRRFVDCGMAPRCRHWLRRCSGHARCGGAAGT